MNELTPEKPQKSCPAEETLAVISGRWKLSILRELWIETKRFSELQRALEGITQKVLTQQLRELEMEGLVVRKVYPQVPPKVKYSLTELGESLQPLVRQMHDWAIDRKREFE